MPQTEERPWKIVYIILCLAILALVAYQFYFQFIRFSPLVPDYRGYVGAVQALNHMQNPYILDNINQYDGNVLPFVYPPHTLYLFWFLQYLFIFQNIWAYFAFLAVLVIVSSYLLLTLDQKPHYLFLATLMVSAFISLWWNFTRGNKDIFFLFFFTVIFTLLAMEKYRQSSVVMGLTIGFTLFATQFAALYLVIRRPIRERLGYIVMSIGVAAGLFLVSYCINPPVFLSYVGTMLGSDNQLIQLDGWNCPTPYGLFFHFLGGASPESLPVIFVSCVYIGIILYATWKYYQNHNGEPLRIYSLVMLSLFMVLPRMMPYNFIILVIPVYFLFRMESYRIKSLALAIVSLLPLIIWYLPVFSIHTEHLPLFLGSYVQAYSLFLIFLMIIVRDHLASSSNAQGKILGE